MNLWSIGIFNCIQWEVKIEFLFPICLLFLSPHHLLNSSSSLLVSSAIFNMYQIQECSLLNWVEIKEHLTLMSYLPIVKSVGVALLGRENFSGVLVSSQTPNRLYYDSGNNGQGRQSFVLLAYQSLGFKGSVVNAPGLQFMAGA